MRSSLLFLLIEDIRGRRVVVNGCLAKLVKFTEAHFCRRGAVELKEEEVEAPDAALEARHARGLAEVAINKDGCDIV